MKREISRKKAEQDLEKAVADFDLVGEFLGGAKQGFLNMYRKLHAQLREGDELKIKIHKSRSDVDHKSVSYEPNFDIVLISKGIEQKIVYSIGLTGEKVISPGHYLYHKGYSTLI